MPTGKGPRHRALSGLSNSHELPFNGSLPETSSNLPTGKALTRLCISTIWPQPFLFACVMNTISLGLSHIRLGTMADLAIIVYSSYNYSHFYQSKRVQKMNFQWNCYKNCQVAFHLVLQFTANLFCSRKSAKIIPTGSWFLHRWYFYFGHVF